MPFLDVDGARIHYVVEGDGPLALAFLHGWSSRLEHWDAQATAFGPTHRIVRIDRRGMGRSIAAAPATAPAQHADDLAAVLDAVGVERAVVFAHAGGGPCGLTFAVRHAARTEGLVVVDSNLHPGGLALEDDPFARHIAAMVEAMTGPDGDGYLRRTYGGYFGPRADKDVVEGAIEHLLGLPREVVVADLRLALIDSVGLAGEVRCPVLWASARPDDARTVRSAFTGCDLAIGHVVGSAHFPQVEVPEQLNPMIARFLELLAVEGRA